MESWAFGVPGASSASMCFSSFSSHQHVSSNAARILGRHVPDESNASLRMVADQASAEQTRHVSHITSFVHLRIFLIVMVWVLGCVAVG